MATLNDYFRTEAHDFLRTLERSLTRAPAPDATELHRAVRGLRGTAQMAREQRVFEVVSALEAVTRSLAGGALAWSDQLAAHARETIADLRALLDVTEDDEQLDARVAAATERWHDGGSIPAPAAVRTPVAGDDDRRAFREFAAREAAGISDAIDRGLRDLQADPMDREPLRTILRRQRALLGSARLDEVPVVAEILRALEDLTRVIAKLDVGVKKEWLDIYRVARDALQTTIAPLLHDKQPEPSHAVSRLRHMREELLERYGANEDAAPAHEVLGPTTAAQAAPPPPAVQQPPIAPFISRSAAHPVSPAVPERVEPPADVEHDSVLELGEESIVAVEDDVVALDVQEEIEDSADFVEDVIEIDSLSYTREDALDRALELYDALARAVADDPRAHDIVEELFDLIRIARSER